MNLPRGIISVLQTPFDEAGAVDFGSLARLVKDALVANVAGFLVPVVASEVAFLTANEREAILRQVIQQVAGRVPVIAGASADDPEFCHRFCGEANDLGASACLIA